MPDTNSSFQKKEKTTVVVSKSKHQEKGSDSLPKSCKTLQEFSDRLQDAIRRRL